MTEESIHDAFEEQLLARTAHLASLVSIPDRRAVIIEATRAVDREHALLLGGLKPDPDDDELAELEALGYSRAIGPLVDESTGLPWVPLFRGAGGGRADAFLREHGLLMYMNHWLRLSQHGLCRLERSDEAWEFKLGNGTSGELFDRAHHHFATKQFVEDWSRALTGFFDSVDAHVNERMSALVRPWRQHYIGYDADELVDVYFLTRATLHAHGMHGSDVFPDDAELGGVPFSVYKDVTIAVIALSLKHLGFAFHLLKKSPTHDLEDVVTIWCERDTLVESIAYVLSLDEESVSTAIDALTMNSSNAAFHSTESVVPPFIAIGENKLLRSITGSTRAPFFFLTRELRRLYRRDWDRSVDLRESTFRSDLVKLFSGERYLTSNRSVKIKDTHLKQIITDIDVVIYDRQACTLGLFQLKWQDAFGYDVKERASRKKNFISGGNDWIARVDNWLASASPQAVSSAFGIPAAAFERVPKFKLFVLGRHYAMFSGEADYDGRAAWGTWYRVLKIGSEKGFDATDPLGDLHALLSMGPKDDSFSGGDSAEYSLGDLRVRFTVEDSAK